MSNLSFGERVAQNAWRLAPTRVLSSVIGWSARRHLPGALGRSLVGAYARAYGLSTAEAEHPLAHYPTLQALFTRRLAPGARRMPDDAGAVVAPSDGTICEAGIAREGTLLEAKGSAFTLSQLLADEDLAARLTGGPYVVIYLSPRDYHRVHFPLGGKVVAWRHIPGKLFPVGPRSVRRECGLFARNERFVTVVDSPGGRYAVVMVAAVGVGHVTATYDPEVATHEGGFSKKGVRHKVFETPIPIERGQELGVFNLGSTTVTIFEPGRVQLAPLSSDSPVVMGSSVGRVVI
jgi:phosphatidylserine decarboxylase